MYNPIIFHRLAEFAEAHEGAHFILLHHEVDEALGEVICEVQKWYYSSHINSSSQ